MCSWGSSYQWNKVFQWFIATRPEAVLPTLLWRLLSKGITCLFSCSTTACELWHDWFYRLKVPKTEQTLTWQVHVPCLFGWKELRLREIPLKIFQQLLWKRNFMGHKLLLQPEIHFRSGQVTTLRKKVTEALTGRPWIAGTLWPEAAGGWQQNQLPEFTDSTLLQKNVSHLVPEQHLILHLQHLLLHLRESSVNQWRHQWSELIRNRQSASRFQKKVQVSTGICRAFASFPPGIWGGRRRSPGQGTCGTQIIDGVMLGSWGKCLQFHHWNDVAIADFASKIFVIYENPKCAMCKSWLSATCRRSLDRSFDLQLFLFLHLATGCNHECRCKECLAKNEVSPAPPRMPTPPQKRLQRTSETSCNSVQLRSPLCPQWNHVRTKKIQEWNTLDSHHGGLGRCSGMFFCLVFSVGPLWVHAVDCERWCAQPLGCTRHATRGSLEVTMLGGMGRV